MDFKNEISLLRTKLSGISAVLGSITKSMRPQRSFKQELMQIEVGINQSVGKLEEIEMELIGK